MTRIVHIGVVALVVMGTAVPAAAAPIDVPRLVSRTDGRSGAPANHAAFEPSLSNSGRYLTSSTASHTTPTPLSTTT